MRKNLLFYLLFYTLESCRAPYVYLHSKLHNLLRGLRTKWKLYIPLSMIRIRLKELTKLIQTKGKVTYDNQSICELTMICASKNETFTNLFALFTKEVTHIIWVISLIKLIYCFNQQSNAFFFRQNHHSAYMLLIYLRVSHSFWKSVALSGN